MYRFYNFNITLDISCGPKECEDKYRYIYCGEPILFDDTYMPIESKEVTNLKDLKPERIKNFDTMTLYYIVNKRCLEDSMGIYRQAKNVNDTLKITLNRKQVDSLFILISSSFSIPFTENISEYKSPIPLAPNECCTLLTFDLGFRGEKYIMSLDHYDQENLIPQQLIQYLINCNLKFLA